MAANSSEKKEDEAVAAEEEDEEEALSLCDLPDNSNKEEDCQARIKADSSHHQEAVITEPPQQEEFDFLLWGGPFSKESEMCVADEVFFQGQILPLCCKSLSSDASRRLLPAVTTGFNRSESSKSESVTSEFKSSGSSSSSSRSSSIRSQNSSSSNSISSTITSTTNPEMSKPRIRNHHQFHTNPSPKPQLKASANSSRQVSIIGGHHLNRKSSTWDFFRLGVAPAPEIGLQDLKVRCSNNNKNKTCVSRNSSNSSSSSSSDRKRMSNHGFRQMVRGCKCSVETVPFDIMITKSTKKTESTTTHAVKEKAKQRKKAMSRHRTFEWMKELPHAGYGYNDEEEALLLNS